MDYYDRKNELLHNNDKVLSIKDIGFLSVTEKVEIQLQDRKIIITPCGYGGELCLDIDEEYHTK